MPRGSLRLVAVGDVHPNSAQPENVFGHVGSVLRSGDVRFCQLECTLSDLGVQRTDVRNPAHRVSPSNVAALTAGAFDVVSFASNNALDYGVEPFTDTIARLKRHGMAVVGAGPTLAEARRPIFVERNGVRLAFLSACSILRDGYEATPGRAGVAPLHVHTFYEPLENIYEQPGTPPRTWTLPDPDELSDIRTAIGEAKRSADLVIACFHWGVHFTYDLAMYQPEVAYAAVDAGADLVIGTHPHCLQAFDSYKGKIIAYSLGNFVFEQDAEVSRRGVTEYLSFYGIPVDTEYPRVPHPKHTKLTGVVTCDVEAGKIARVNFLPAMIGADARPHLVSPEEAEFREIVELVSRLSADLGTGMVMEAGCLAIQPSKKCTVDVRQLLRRRKVSYPSLRYLSTVVE